jgi:hypothetical protein
MRADDLQPHHLRHSLLAPHVRFHRRRVSRAFVRANEPKGGPSPCHDDPRTCLTYEANGPILGQAHLDRPGDAILACRENNFSRPCSDRALDGLGVIGLPITNSTVRLHPRPNG